MKADEVGAILRKATTRSERILWLGALLSRESGHQIVIIGGAAVEVYSSGRFISEDVDLVGDRPSIVNLLESWGFKREGRLWTKAVINFWIDPVGKPYKGNARLLTDVATPYGHVQVASVEDLIAKRLIEVKGWPTGSREMFNQALALATEHSDRIEWDYIQAVAERNGAQDLVEELRRQARRFQSRA